MFATRTLTRPLRLNRGRVSALGWTDVGWQRLSQVCLGLQVLFFWASRVMYHATDIDVRWSSDVEYLGLSAALVALFVPLCIGTAVLLGASLVMYWRWFDRAPATFGGHRD